ncbi:hypothetical protein T01_4418 [Trichinella spiralis]|uniref:Uncharacterized protein n=1 Tax=Trichinella spiralis TaxID=6334 RepID=A0A0V1APN2_TRISP|nr:hypothetical protein T01_4418 [Trichinella spiralis]
MKERNCMETSACSYSTDGCCVGLSIALFQFDSTHYWALRMIICRIAISIMVLELPETDAG